MPMTCKERIFEAMLLRFLCFLWLIRAGDGRKPTKDDIFQGNNNSNPSSFKTYPLIHKAFHQVTLLPEFMTEFTLHPPTGDLFTANPETNRVYRFAVPQDGELTAQPLVTSPVLCKPKEPVDPEKEPYITSMVYKAYENVAFVAVVCQAHSTIYLLDPQTLAVQETRDFNNSVSPRVQDQVRLITSTNPQDPWLFYIQWNRYSSSDQQAVHIAQESLDTTFTVTFYYRVDGLVPGVSADGSLLCLRRGLVRRTVLFNDTGIDPKISRLSSFGYSVSAYGDKDDKDKLILPDPSGLWVAYRNQIFNPYVEGQNHQAQLLTTLSFEPSVITAANLFGLVAFSPFQDTWNWSSLEIQWANYDGNMTLVTGTNLTIPGAQEYEKRPEFRSGISFKWVGSKLLLDEKFGRLIHAYGKRIGVASIDCFSMEPEALRLSTYQTLIGQGEQVIQVDETGGELTMPHLPQGATFQNKEIRWTPTEGQIGVHRIDATLVANSKACPVSFDIETKHKSLPLPAIPRSMVVSVEEQSVFLMYPASAGIDKWDGKEEAEETDDSLPRGLASDQFIISVLSLSDGKILKSMTYGPEEHLPQYGFSFYLCFNRLIVVPKGCLETLEQYAYIIDAETLHLLLKVQYKKEHSYSHCFVNVDVHAGVLIAGTTRVNLKDLSQTKMDSPYNEKEQGYAETSYNFFGITRYGAWLEDHLNGNLLLVFLPGSFFVKGSAKNVGTASLESWTKPDQAHVSHVPGARAYVQVYADHEQGKAYEDRYPTKNLVKLRVYNYLNVAIKNVTIFENLNVAIKNVTIFENRYNQRIQFTVSPTEDGVLISCDNQLINYSLDGIDSTTREDSFFHITVDHSIFRVEPNGKTKLAHRVLGATSSVGVYDDAGISFLTVDETGLVTIDGNGFAQAALRVLVDFGTKHGLAQLRLASLKGIYPWSNLPEAHRPKGIPVAAPVFLRAVDQSGNTAMIRYYVYSDVSFDAVSEALSESIIPAPDPPESGPNMDLILKILLILSVGVCFLCLAVGILIFYMLKLRKRERARGKKDDDLAGLLQEEEGDSIDDASESKADSREEKFHDELGADDFVA